MDVNPVDEQSSADKDWVQLDDVGHSMHEIEFHLLTTSPSVGTDGREQSGYGVRRVEVVQALVRDSFHNPR